MTGPVRDQKAGALPSRTDRFVRGCGARAKQIAKEIGFRRQAELRREVNKRINHVYEEETFRKLLNGRPTGLWADAFRAMADIFAERHVRLHFVSQAGELEIVKQNMRNRIFGGKTPALGTQALDSVVFAAAPTAPPGLPSRVGSHVESSGVSEQSPKLKTRRPGRPPGSQVILPEGWWGALLNIVRARETNARIKMSDADIASKLALSPSTLRAAKKNGAISAESSRGMMNLLGINDLEDLIREISENTETREFFHFEDAARYVADGNIEEGMINIGNQVDNLFEDWPLPPIPGNDMGDSAKWLSIYRFSPDSVWTCFMGKKLVAYWHFVAVQDSVYDEIRSGRNINAAIRPKDLLPLSIGLPGRMLSIYFVDLCMKKSFLQGVRPKTRWFMNSLSKFFLQKAQAEIFIRRIVAHASTPEAEHFCKELGFIEICEHQTHRRYEPDGRTITPTKIFEFTISDDTVKESYMFRRNPDLQHLYRSSQGHAP